MLNKTIIILLFAVAISCSNNYDSVKVVSYSKYYDCSVSGIQYEVSNRKSKITKKYLFRTNDKIEIPEILEDALVSGWRIQKEIIRIDGERLKSLIVKLDSLVAYKTEYSIERCRDDEISEYILWSSSKCKQIPYLNCTNKSSKTDSIISEINRIINKTD